MPKEGEPTSGIIDLRPPQPTEVEVSIFGPGFGECLVVHLGHGDWLVVDSCIRPGGRLPAAVEYLEQLGVNVAEHLKIIVATHWHDDHVRGISDILRRAEKGRFYAPSALQADEFLMLVQRRDIVSKFSSGVKELSTVQEIIADRQSRGGPPIALLGAGQRLRNEPGSAVMAIWSLSPSDEDTRRGLMHISSLLPSAGRAASRVPSVRPNDTSVALLLETVAGAVLLGADLEHHKSTRFRGWHAVRDHSGNPKDAATLFKIPHHGSVGADCPEVWEHDIGRDPVCILSPFERGRVRLPTATDVRRIGHRAGRAFVTSVNRTNPLPRDRTTQKIIKESVRRFSPDTLKMGQIQLRSTGEGWTVGLSPEARPLD